MLSISTNTSWDLLQNLDLSLGGYRIRLESPSVPAFQITHLNGVSYLPFVDLVGTDSPAPDLALKLQAASNLSDWMQFLAPGGPPQNSLVAERGWYFQELENGEELLVVANLELPEYYMLVRLGAGRKKGVLVYNTVYHPDPLDLSRLLCYPLDRLLVVNQLMRGDGILLHASAFATPNGVLLFTGPSGAGKTTLCRLSQQFSDCEPLCDERIVVRYDQNSPTGFRAFGTPWPGEGNIYNRIDGPLAGVFLIRHSSINELKPATGINALSWILQETFPTSWHHVGFTFTLDFITQMLEKLPCYNFGFVPTTDAITYARQALNTR